MKFDLLYVDNPFHYAKRNKGKKFGLGSSTYNTMSDASLIRLKPLIDEITNSDCMLLSWSSGALLRRNIEICERWGFKTITFAFVWVKTTDDNYKINKIDRTKKIRILPGNYTSSSTEVVMLFRKGNALKRYKRLVNQIILEPEIITGPLQEHSRKPDIIRLRIDELFGNEISKLELFARKFPDSKYTENFTLIGNEISGNDIKIDLKKLIIQ